MKNKRYFSIVELIVACAVIAILVGIASGTYRLVMFKVNEARTRSLVKKLEMAMRSYRHETGYYFQTESPLDPSDPGTTLLFGPLVIREGDETFVRLIDYSKMLGRKEIVNNRVVDAWGNAIGYRFPGTINTTLFDIGSKGPNGVWGEATPPDNSDNSDNFGQYDDITNTNM